MGDEENSSLLHRNVHNNVAKSIHGSNEGTVRPSRTNNVEVSAADGDRNKLRSVQSVLASVRRQLRFSAGDVNPRLAWAADRIVAHTILATTEDADTWMYLFADLSCVVVFYKVSLVILECGDYYRNLGATAVMFLTVFGTRLAYDDYSNRFTARFNRVMYFVYSVGMFLMALNATAFKQSAMDLEMADAGGTVYSCADDKNEYFVGFSLGFLVTRGVLVLILARLMLLDRKCREQFRVDLLRNVGSFVLVAVGCVISSQRHHHSPDHPTAPPVTARTKIHYFLAVFLFEWTLLAIDMVIMASVKDSVSICPCLGKGTSVVQQLRVGASDSVGDEEAGIEQGGSPEVPEEEGESASETSDEATAGLDWAKSLVSCCRTATTLRFNYHYPLDIYRHQSRLGLFIMMILGEVILELGIPPYDSAVAQDINVFAFCMLLLSFALGIQYYDCVHRLPGSPHAMQRSALNAFAFTWLHPMIGYCMLLVTVAATRIYSKIHHDEPSVPVEFRQFLSYSVAAVVAVLTFTRLLHKGILHGTFSPLYQCRVLFVLAHMAVQYSSLGYRWDVALHAALALLLALLDLLAYRVKHDLGWQSAQSVHMQRLLYHTIAAENAASLMAAEAGRKGTSPRARGPQAYGARSHDSADAIEQAVEEEGGALPEPTLFTKLLDTPNDAPTRRMSRSPASPEPNDRSPGPMDRAAGSSHGGMGGADTTLHHSLSMSDSLFARRASAHGAEASSAVNAADRNVRGQKLPRPSGSSGDLSRLQQHK